LVVEEEYLHSLLQPAYIKAPISAHLYNPGDAVAPAASCCCCKGRVFAACTVLQRVQLMRRAIFEAADKCIYMNSDAIRVDCVGCDHCREHLFCCKSVQCPHGADRHCGPAESVFCAKFRPRRAIWAECRISQRALGEPRRECYAHIVSDLPAAFRATCTDGFPAEFESMHALYSSPCCRRGFWLIVAFSCELFCAVYPFPSTPP
jgi:hypothetical protein